MYIPLLTLGYIGGCDQEEGEIEILFRRLEDRLLHLELPTPTRSLLVNVSVPLVNPLAPLVSEHRLFHLELEEGGTVKLDGEAATGTGFRLTLSLSGRQKACATYKVLILDTLNSISILNVAQKSSRLFVDATK